MSNLTARPISAATIKCPVAWCESFHGPLLPGTVHSRTIVEDDMTVITVSQMVLDAGYIGEPVLNMYGNYGNAGPKVHAFAATQAQALADIFKAHAHDVEFLTDGLTRAAGLIKHGIRLTAEAAG